MNEPIELTCPQCVAGIPIKDPDAMEPVVCRECRAICAVVVSFVDDDKVGVAGVSLHLELVRRPDAAEGEPNAQ